MSMPFTDIDIGEYGDSLEWDMRVEHMLENGVSYALSLDSAGRDGMFYRESILMVDERSDVIALRDFFVKLVEQPE